MAAALLRSPPSSHLVHPSAVLCMLDLLRPLAWILHSFLVIRMTTMTSVGLWHMTNCQRMKVERCPSEIQTLVLVEEVTKLELKSE